MEEIDVGSTDLLIRKTLNPSAVTLKSSEMLKESDEEGGKDVSITKSSVIGGACNTANTILGASVITIPYVMKVYGIVLGTFLIIAVAFITIFIVWLLLLAKDRTGLCTYSSIAHDTLGYTGSVITKLAIILNNFGLCAVYLCIYASLWPSLMQEWTGDGIQSNRQIWIVILALFMIPAIFNRSMGILRFASMTGVGAITIFTITLFIKFINGGITNSDNSKAPIPLGTGPDFLVSFPDLFIAYDFHYNIFPIYDSLKERNNRSMMKSTVLGISIAAFVFSVVGIIGYIIYGTDVTGNIIDNLAKSTDATSIVAKLAYTLSSTMSFPLLYFGARNNIEYLIVDAIKHHNGLEHWEFSKKGFAMMTVIIYVFILAIALFYPDINLFFSIIGCLAASLIAWILPSLFFIQSSEPCTMRSWAWIIVVAGVILSILGFGSKIFELSTGYSS